MWLFHASYSRQCHNFKGSESLNLAHPAVYVAIIASYSIPIPFKIQVEACLFIGWLKFSTFNSFIVSVIVSTCFSNSSISSWLVETGADKVIFDKIQQKIANLIRFIID